MRARTHSFALLPATSTLATIVLTVAWWMTMIGLTSGTPADALLWIGVAVLGTAAIAIASDPRTRTHVWRLIDAFGPTVRRTEPPGAMVRWTHLRAASDTLCRSDIEVLRMGRPRAPGRVLPTA